ncbi:MAG: hypothetical protein ACYDC6_05170 [Acidobacteriaceae bacterium]
MKKEIFVCVRQRTADLRRPSILAATVCLVGSLVAQSTAAPPPQSSPRASTASGPAAQTTRITQEQAQQLFRSVDSILQFDSKATGLPVLHSVHRGLVTRDEVEHYLMQQLHDDRDAKRLERSELVLKKFGLLDRDFQLQPFLIQLFREQIAGYYNDKTKTVNLLDWIPPEEQKPVLAHELTHALQDQHIHLAKWDQQGSEKIAKNVQQDNRHIATDEDDTARDAVVEGQAMAVFIDYALAPAGKNILTAPQTVDKMNQAMADSSDSPTLSSAPLLLQRSLIFPYVQGLDFVRAVLAAKGQQAAFAGTLDRPPSSTYQIMTPKVYMDHAPVPLLHMPDIHSLIEAHYSPYDVGVMGEFDVQILTELFGGPAAANALTPAWRGGIYYTAQSKEAKTAAEQDSPASLALLYLSRWATPQAAQSFAEIYAREVPRKYDRAISKTDGLPEPANTREHSWIWDTAEGPVLIVRSGRTVYISESFPMNLARKLQLVMMGSIQDSSGSVLVRTHSPNMGMSQPNLAQISLTAPLRRSLFRAGIPRAALKMLAKQRPSAAPAEAQPAR